MGVETFGMTSHVDDDPEYTDDVADDRSVDEPLPEPTDPAQVPADEGDAGAA